VAKKFQCPCGFEDDNEANFNFHQHWCTRKPRYTPLRPNQFQYEQPPEQSDPESDPEPSFRLNKADKVLGIIIVASFVLYLLTLLW